MWRSRKGEKMLLSIISIVINIIFFVVLNLEIFTDRAVLPDGIRRTWHNSAIDRLSAADLNWLLYLQIFFSAVSVITGILYMCGLRNNAVKIIRLVSLIGSAVVFAVIMLVSAATHPTY